MLKNNKKLLMLEKLCFKKSPYFQFLNCCCCQIPNQFMLLLGIPSTCEIQHAGKLSQKARFTTAHHRTIQLLRRAGGPGIIQSEQPAFMITAQTSKLYQSSFKTLCDSPCCLQNLAGAHKTNQSQKPYHKYAFRAGTRFQQF